MGAYCKVKHWMATPAIKQPQDEEAAESTTDRPADQPATSWLEEPTVRPTCRSPPPLEGARHRRKGRVAGRTGPVTPRPPRDPVVLAVDKWIRTPWKPATEIEARISALEWWRSYESVHPMIASIARRILSLQASSAASERSFSKGGLIVSKKRQCLTGARVDGLSLVGWYYDEQYQHNVVARGGNAPSRKKKRVV